MDLAVEKRSKKRPVKKIILAAVIAILAAIVVFTVWLYWWDGGYPTGNQRLMRSGVQLDLKTVATAKGTVEYDLFGSEGPVVLSIHAGLGGADQGRLFASFLQEDGYRILSPSRPGYLGTPLASGTTLEEQADLIAALLDTLQMRKVGVLSASAGGPVSYTFAAKYPERVWGLVSIGGISKPVPAKPSGSRSPIRKIFMDTVGQKLVQLTAKLSYRSVVTSTLAETSLFDDKQKQERADYILNTPDKLDMFKAMLGTTFPYEERTAGTDIDAAEAKSMQPLPLEKIEAPSFIIHGTLDGDVPFENGQYASEHIPGARHYWMENDDHLGFWLSPEAGKAQEAARAFLRQHAPAE